MKIFLTYFVITFAVLTAEDNIDVKDKAIIDDEKLFHAFYTCMMDQGPCQDRLKMIKEFLPKFIETQCSDCLPEDKKKYERYRVMISEKYPKEYKDMLDKYRPKNQ